MIVANNYSPNNSQFENYSWQKSSFKLAQIYLVCSLSVLNKIWRVSLEKKNIDSKPPQQGKLEIKNSKYYQTARNVSRRNFDDIYLIHFGVISLETVSEQSGCSNSDFGTPKSGSVSVKTFKTGDFFWICWICRVVWISCKNFWDFSKLLKANVRTLESLNTYLSIPRVLSLNSVKKILEPILLTIKWIYLTSSRWFKSISL